MKTSDFNNQGSAFIHLSSEEIDSNFILLNSNKYNTKIKELTNTDDLIGEVTLSTDWYGARFTIIYYHPEMDQSKITITQNEPVTAPKLTRGEKVAQWFKNLCMRKD